MEIATDMVILYGFVACFEIGPIPTIVRAALDPKRLMASTDIEQ